MSSIDCTKIKYNDDEKAYLTNPKELYTGKCECFHSNKVKSLENNYKEGLLHGNSFIWYPNGQIQLESQYDMGNRIGTFKTYYTNGQLETETDYKGESIKRMIKYKENGEIELKLGE